VLDSLEKHSKLLESEGWKLTRLLQQFCLLEFIWNFLELFRDLMFFYMRSYQHFLMSYIYNQWSIYMEGWLQSVT
jgi:hypothetical protein